MSKLFLAIRLATWGLFAACAWILIYDENDTGLFLGLLFWAWLGVAVLVVRLRVRRWKRTLP